MNWIIHQLFGAHATDHLSDKIKAALATYIAANPSLSKDAVVAWAMSQAKPLIDQVLKYFPGYAAPILSMLLNEALPSIVSAAYDEVAKAIAQK